VAGAGAAACCDCGCCGVTGAGAEGAGAGAGVVGCAGVGAGVGVGVGAGVGGVGGGVGTVGVGTVGVGTVGTGTVGRGAGGAGRVGAGSVGTGNVGSGGSGGGGGRSRAWAETASTAATTVPTTPQIRRTPVQLRGGRTGFGLRGVFLASMRLEQDHYDVLGVSRDASGQEIKRAFRALVRRLHPDVATQPQSRTFHEVVAAYEVLSHPAKRTLYDRLGLRGRRRPAARPAPAVPPIELSLEWYEAERGVARQVEFEEVVACAACRGRGVPQGVTAAECVTCRGSGRLSRVTESKTLRLLEFNACSACGGTGRVAAPSCLDCAGKGSTTSLQSLRVRVPGGVRDGDLIQVEGVERRFRLNVGTRPRDSSAVLLLAGVALACAVGLLLFLLLR
jgi:hypothetical protein